MSTRLLHSRTLLVFRPLTGAATAHAWPAYAAFAAAFTMAFAAMAGLLWPSTYAQETLTWTAQGMGQDWVDLAVAAPLLAFSAAGAVRRSRGWTLVLAGTLTYTVYTYFVYAFAMHFNELFLVYCATLGFSLFALAGVLVDLGKAGVATWFDEATPATSIGSFLAAVALVFAAMWLWDVIPALVAHTLPSDVADAGLIVSPVHVLDLSIFLPASLLAGGALIRRHPIGWLLAPAMLGFLVLMAIAVAGMEIMSSLQGLPSSFFVAAMMFFLAAGAALALSVMFAHLRQVRGSVR